MKIKKILCLLLTLAVLLGSTVIPALAEDNIKVLLDGEELVFDVPPRIIDGRTMVPMRAIFEAMGAAVEWEGETQTVMAGKGDITIFMQINNAVMFINGNEITLDVPPQLVDNRTLVPVRAVAEGLNALVEWDGDTQTVIITSSAPGQMLTYKNETYGFSFEYPSYWELSDLSNDESMYFNKIDPDNESGVTSFLSVSLGGPAVDLDAVADNYLNRSLDSEELADIDVKSIDSVSVDGVAAKRFIENVNQENFSLTMIYYVLNIGDNLFIFAGLSEIENAEKDIPEIDAMFNSLKFEDAALYKTKRVGGEGHGYITIPSNWVNYMDASMIEANLDHVGFMSFDGIIILLSDFGQTQFTLEEAIQNTNWVSNPQKTEIAGFEAYRLDAYFDISDSYLYVWYFVDNNGNLHYISAEGPADKITEALEIVTNTFSLEK